MIKGHLFQEDLCKDPFWMLMACCMANLTTWKLAEPVFNTVRRKYRTVDQLAKADPKVLYGMIYRLGLGHMRAQRIADMARAYVAMQPKTSDEVSLIPGCGKYACDSWAIFVEGRRDVVPTDKELLLWLENNNETDKE